MFRTVISSNTPGVWRGSIHHRQSEYKLMKPSPCLIRKGNCSHGNHILKKKFNTKSKEDKVANVCFNIWKSCTRFYRWSVCNKNHKFYIYIMYSINEWKCFDIEILHTNTEYEKGWVQLCIFSPCSLVIEWYYYVLGHMRAHLIVVHP